MDLNCPHCGWTAVDPQTKRCLHCKKSIDAPLPRSRQPGPDVPSWWDRFWFRLWFGGFKRACRRGRGALYDAVLGGKSQFVRGQTLMNCTHLQVRLDSEGLNAWNRALADPRRVQFALTCKCGFMHVIRDAYDPTPDSRTGSHRYRSPGFGGFYDHYHGAWRAPWFELMRFGPNLLRCQKCDAEGTPRVRLG